MTVMRLFSLLLRLLFLVAGAIVGFGLLAFAVVGFIGLLLVSLLTGRKPNLQFRVNKNPWAPRRPPAPDDVVDVEAREVNEARPTMLPLQPPRQR